MEIIDQDIKKLIQSKKIEFNQIDSLDNIKGLFTESNS